VSPNPAITLPTTRFVTQRNFPENLFAGDHPVARRSDAHLPLVFLLTFSQLAVGASLAAIVIGRDSHLLLLAAAAGLISLFCGSFHLGQPLKAWRSFLGWRRSWFSREVITLSAFNLLILAGVISRWIPITHHLQEWFRAGTAATGLLTVVCSAMIYVKTGRAFWSATQSFGRFFGTTVLLGVAAALTGVISGGSGQGAVAVSALSLVGVTIIKLAFERRVFLHLVDEEELRQTPLNKTAGLLAGELNGFVRARIAVAILGGILIPVIALVQDSIPPASRLGLTALSFGLCIVGEIIERYLFFTAVVTQRMPGGLAS
jgi:DMSO reductase anchor subunit